MDLRQHLASFKLNNMTPIFNEIELRKLDLNLLLVFSAMMRERSVSRAASRLYLGASAISMALGRLREAVGDELFVRGPGGMKPTTRADALWLKIEPALSAIESAVRDVRSFDPTTATTVIRFAAPDDLEFILIPRLLDRLKQRAPNMRLIVRSSDFRSLLNNLDLAEADLALSAKPPSGIEPRHHVVGLYTEGFAAVFDPAMTGFFAPLTLKQYLETPQLLLSIRGDLHGPIDDQLAAIGHARHVFASVCHFPTIPFVLRACRALANIPATAAYYFAEAYGLATCPLPLPSPEFDVALIWHARTNGDPAHAWFRHLVEAEVAQIRATALAATGVSPAG
jgi:LysR family transcriptional activator of mexEF-oprN operon